MDMDNCWILILSKRNDFLLLLPFLNEKIKNYNYQGNIAYALKKAGNSNFFLFKVKSVNCFPHVQTENKNLPCNYDQVLFTLYMYKDTN